MPVTDDDLEAAADRYAASLPDALDLAHLGLGPDGHSASLVPGDPVLEVTDKRVAVTAGEYQGVRRMTLTYPELHRVRRLLWVVTGEEKVDALAQAARPGPVDPRGPRRARRRLADPGGPSRRPGGLVRSYSSCRRSQMGSSAALVAAPGVRSRRV